MNKKVIHLKERIEVLIKNIKADNESLDVYDQAYVDALDHVLDMIKQL